MKSFCALESLAGKVHAWSGHLFAHTQIETDDIIGPTRPMAG
jgi:hypothetical protein